MRRRTFVVITVAAGLVLLAVAGASLREAGRELGRLRALYGGPAATARPGPEARAAPVELNGRTSTATTLDERPRGPAERSRAAPSRRPPGEDASTNPELPTPARSDAELRRALEALLDDPDPEVRREAAALKERYLGD